MQRLLLNLFLPGLMASSWHAYAQNDTSFHAPLAANEQVIGTGNFVTNGSDTRIKTTPTQYLLCTTVNKQEVCSPIVASSTMDGIAVTTSSAPDGTPLVHFKFDPASPRYRVNMAYAVARFLGRLSVVSEDLEHRTDATAPGDAAAKTKCGGNSALTAGTTSNGNDCDTNGGGAGPPTDPGTIPDAGTVVVSAPYRNPDPLPNTDTHGDPVTPPVPDTVPVIVVPGPRKADAPIIVPIPRALPNQETIPTTKIGFRLWDGCVVTPIGITCANAGRRNKADPNAIPPVPSVPPPVNGNLDDWWASWWKWPTLDWCKLIGYGCTAKNTDRTPTRMERINACHDSYGAAVTYCTRVELPYRGETAFVQCMKQASDILNQCIQDIPIDTLITGDVH